MLRLCVGWVECAECILHIYVIDDFTISLCIKDITYLLLDYHSITSAVEIV